MQPLHRKTRKSYNEPGHAHFLTCSRYRRLPLLTKDRTRFWMIEAMETMRREQDVDLWAYVIMPEHVHLLVHPRQQHYKMSRILAAVKRPVSSRAKQFLQETNNTDWLTKLSVRKG